MQDTRDEWWFRVIWWLMVAALVYIAVGILTGCAPMEAFVTRDPVTGQIPAISATGTATISMLDGFIQSGLFAGILGFLGTYGKTTWRWYLAWSERQSGKKDN